MFGSYLQAVRDKKPLIHNITNAVTINDCANITLACGASPIMANEPLETAEITSICNGLNVNIGMLNTSTIQAMFNAIHKANELHHTVLLDPVGAGASKLRKDTLKKMFEECSFTVVRGNLSEIRSIINGQENHGGVDANAEDLISADNLDAVVTFARQAASILHCVVAITGATDVVADEHKAYCIHNGHTMMSRVTGSGCMCSSLTAAFLAANPEHPLEACAAAVVTMGLSGEIAYNRLTPMDGNASYRTYIIDAVYNMTPAMLEEGENYEVR